MRNSSQGSRPGTALAALVLAAAVAFAATACSGGGPEKGSSTQARAAQSAATRTVSIPVQGMVCLSCAATIKRRLKELDGVSDVEAVFDQRVFRITYVVGRPDVPRLAVAAINDLGYRAGTPVAAR